MQNSGRAPGHLKMHKHLHSLARLLILMWLCDPVVAPIPPKPIHFLQENNQNDWYRCVSK